jgi:hypothetical protein
MKYENIIQLRLPEIQLLAVVPTQLKFSIVKDHDEPTILTFLNNVRKVGSSVLSRTSCM